MPLERGARGGHLEGPLRRRHPPREVVEDVRRLVECGALATAVDYVMKALTLRSTSERAQMKRERKATRDR